MEEITLFVEWLAWRLPVQLVTRQTLHFRRMLRSVRGNARGLVAYNLWWTTPASFLGTYLALYMAEQGLTKIEIGTIVSAQLVVQMLGALCGGFLAERLGRLRIITIVDTVCWPLAYACLAFAHGYLAFLAAAILIGAVFTLMPAWTAMYVEGTPPERRTHLFGILQAVWFAGGILSALTGFIVRAWGVTVSCRIVFGAATLATSFAVWRRSKHLEETMPPDRPLRVSVAELHRFLEGHWSAFRILIRRRQLAILFLAQVLTASAIAVAGTYVNLYLADARGVGLPPAVLALLPLVGGCAVLLTTFLVVPFIAQASAYGFLLLGVGMMASNTTIQLLTPAGALGMIVLGVFIGASGWALYNPSLSGQWQNQMSDRERPRVLAFCTVLSMLVTMPAPTIAGALYTIHPRGPLLMILALYALIGACALWASFRPGRAR